ncbi:TetR/AcrR family transcriptional regulator [Tenacibaculum piscium]|uniref:TetR/AcrR family transcriptional regulator n=1 Tax=Tenacibaculum piscium TaxID=1458515 RepID=UPI001F455CE6|nr:TetR/AcrR family transcriptional regulator [Tenacibaculum piscium]
MDFTKRQLEIIEKATILIGEKGIQNLTTKNLAEKMSFSEPALYRHFKNKTEILNSVLLFYKMQLKNKLTQILKQEIIEIEKIKQMMTFQFKHFSENPAVIMVIFSETSFQFNNELSKTVHQILLQKKKMVEIMIEKGQENKNIRTDISPTQLTTMIMGSMRFLILRWRLSNYEFDLKKEGKDLWETVEKLIKIP